MKTAALDGALLVFHPGSGATVALTDDLLRVFQAIQQAQPDLQAAVTVTDRDDPATSTSAADTLDNCLRLLRQQQLILATTP